ncbi:extracellular solute-binding protein [Paenibacillus macerans]|uniref:extracellular solute-binding protein n=1 Tax=Paenibacillus macerans TaxID=44252 RepID=UPI002E206078|nr:extracellular solute-binding protein [Paenibacillus macerans]
MKLDAGALTYNPEVFEKAGVQVPDGNWTWADFIKLTGQIKDKAGVFGIEKLADIRILQYWIRQSGASLYTSDGSKLGYEDDAIVEQFLTMLKQLTDEKIMPNPDEWAQIASKGKEAQPVVTGDAGIAFDWNNPPVIAAAGNPNLQLLTPPLGERGTKGLWTSPGMFFSVSESSQYLVTHLVAPYAGAWIESREKPSLLNSACVAPLAGAWIESSTSVTKSGVGSPSHPLRMRGLKVILSIDSKFLVSVAPLAGAWIES